MKEVSFKKKINFIMLIGSALHKYGASSDRIEKALMLLSKTLHVESEFFSTPTGLIGSFKLDNENSETRLLRLSLGKVNLAKLLLVDQTVDSVLDEDLLVQNGMDQIETIIKDSPLFSGVIVDISAAIITSTLALFLGGSFIDALVAGVMGYIASFFSENVKTENMNSIIEGVLSFFACIISILLAHFQILPVNPQVVTLASVIIFIPGLMLTTSIAELTSNNLTSGTARLLGAIMILLKISFGVYIAHLIAKYFSLNIVNVSKVSHSILYTTPLVGLTALGFVITFQARLKEYWWICTACILTYLCSYFTTTQLDFAISSFISGAFIAAFSNFFSRVTKKPALITLLPGITLLVPGSIGYNGIVSMINQQTVLGIDTLIKSFLIAVALVSGTFFGSILVKPKRFMDV